MDKEDKKWSELDQYVSEAQDLAGQGKEIILTGPGSVWLYLKVAHCLHGVAMKVVYDSLVYWRVVIFDHNPF